jgi:hypothetical protein
MLDLVALSFASFTVVLRESEQDSRIVFAENYTSDKNPDNSAATSDMQPDYFS